MVSALVLFQEDSAAEQPNVTLTEADVSLPPPKQLPGFENSELPNGWTLYTSETEGFSIALPPGWRTDIRDDLGPTFRFYATDLLPTYAPITAGATPGLFVMRNTTYVGEDPARFWDNVRQQYAAGDTEVELSQSHLRDGVAYVFTTINEVAYGEQAETTYGLLRGVAVYRLVFTVPSPYLDEYEDVFHDIAMTFDIAG